MAEYSSADRERRSQIKSRMRESLSRILVRESILFDVPSDVRFENETLERKTRNRSHSSGLQSVISAGEAKDVDRSSEYKDHTLIPDHHDSGNMWELEEDPIEAWEKTHASVELQVGINEKFASVIVHGESDQLKRWMFEAVALGSNEGPEFPRPMRRPRPVGALIPLETSTEFALNQPLRIALYISKGLSPLGCLIFTVSGAN